ncbi:Retinal-binding protein [Rhynchospora pubera]|uniref:Retinal-binding protein n=1 Tax=Rhynchospora pubera TaxID=906938 RepID=A0AAV8F9J1_9POAL|nr:Retinal-binding protein [Rhynchospora pubera]
MASTRDGLVPITRAYLAKYYDKYPLSPLPDEVLQLIEELKSLSEDLAKVSPLSPEEQELSSDANGDPVYKIDENLWKNREQMEEIIFLLDKSRRPKSIQKATEEDSDLTSVLDEIEIQFKDMLNKLKQFQIKNADNVFNIVMTYLPQDFRGSLIRQQRERSERNKQAQVEALINSGGSIRDKYTLLWNQQMERRRQLAQLGSATGVYKTLVKYLVGVPQVLLDFIKQINDDHGPMEEQRLRYGPSLYTLTRMVLMIRLFILLSWARSEGQKIEKEQVAILQRAANTYLSEFEKFLLFIREVFINSPFFISAEDAGAAEGRKSDEFKETTIPAGKTHEVVLTVEAVNSYIAWDFSLIQSTLSLDIGFHVEYVSPSGEKTLILPYRRYDSDQGNFCTVLAGSYKLVWDNSYSSFFKKNLKYKVDAIPPVVEGSQQTVVEAEAEAEA